MFILISLAIFLLIITVDSVFTLLAARNLNYFIKNHKEINYNDACKIFEMFGFKNFGISRYLMTKEMLMKFKEAKIKSQYLPF
jgi:hypothetical protein